MTEGNPVPGQAAADPRARRLRLASQAAVLAALGVVLALIALAWPAAGLARLSVISSTGGGSLWWAAVPFGVVGFVVAWRKPGNPLGWCLVGMVIAGALSQDGSLYAIAGYRLRHGTLPFGWVAMLAQPGWAIAIVLIGVAILIFPDGRPASPWLRRVLWLYLVPAVAWMVSAYALTVEAIVRHSIRVDSGGNLVTLNNGPSSPHWWNVLQYAVFLTIGLSWLLALAGQAASFRRSSGERRQQLKWLLGGFGAALAGVVIAITLGQAPGVWGAVGHVGLLAIFAVPVAMAVAILKYRLYDIDRIISRTLAYAIVTGLLIGVYAGLVLLAQQVLRFHSTVAVAVSTLVAAALFAPVRRRVQHAVDRRFNRARYDADQTVADFAARLQDAVDLDAVRDDLAGVVRAALEPAHLTLWTARRELFRHTARVTPTKTAVAAAHAAMQAAARLGVACAEPVVLADGANVIVHLSPSPVVAKVAASTRQVRADPGAWLQRELDVAGWLHGTAIPVAEPSPEVPATVHHGDGQVMSFWRYLPPAGDRRPDEGTFGSMLRDLHLALRAYPQTRPALTLPPLAPLQDIPAFLARPRTQVSPQSKATLAAAYARLTAELDRWAAAQVLHGDAGLGNVLPTTAGGWVWHDFEDTCTGPVAWDLAASTASPRLDAARVLAGYGAPVDAGQLAVCQQLRRLHLTVWYNLYAERLPALRPRAAELLAQWPQA